MKMLLIASFCNAFGQTIEPIGGGWFKIDNSYAQQIAMAKDSLKEIKKLYYKTNDILHGCVEKLSTSFEMLNLHRVQEEKLNDQINDYNSIISNKDLIIETLTESRDFLQSTLDKQAKKHKRAKFLQVGAGVGGGLLVGLITGLLIR